MKYVKNKLSEDQSFKLKVTTQGHSPKSFFSWCFSQMSCIWVSSAALWDRKAQQWRRERASEQERGCGGNVRRPACVLRLSTVLLYFNTEQRVCRNRQSCAGLTHNLVRYQQNTEIFDQKQEEVIKLATLWVKTAKRTSKYLPEMSADSQGHTEEVINQRQWQTLH